VLTGPRAAGKPPRGRSGLTGPRASGKPPRGRSGLTGPRASGKPPRGRSLTGAAIIAVFALALAACGPIQLGAAAIVGNQRISTSALTAEVSALQGVLRANKGKIQLQFPQSQAPQEVLGWMVRFAVREQMAKRNHISVTPAESQRALASIAAQARSSAGNVPLYLLAAANGLPRDMLSELGRYQAIQNALISRLDGGTLPSTSAGQQQLGLKFNHEQCIAAKSLHIKINPQFGRVDYRQLSVIPAATALSSPQTPSPSPTSRPQLTPAC
jgi:peptidyl-prolyl cis-trans isomerase SurA